MKKVIIDTDGGVDDVIALIFAAKSEILDIQLILAVGGNVNVGESFRNIVKIFENAGLTMPLLVKGRDTKISFKEKLNLRFIHGFNGLGNIFLSYFKKYPGYMTSLGMFFEKFKGNQPVTIISLGPLTNISEIITEYSINIKEIIISGGIDLQNGKFDFNLRCNKKAALKVLTSGIPIVLVPSMVYSHVYIIKDDLEKLNLYRSQPHVNLIQRLLKGVIFKFWDKKICLPDLLPVAVAIKSDLVNFRTGYFKETKSGNLEFEESKSGNIKIVTDANIYAFWSLFYRTILNSNNKFLFS